MSLRGRLLAAILAVSALGLIVAGLATNRALHAFLIDRVDRQLTASIPAAISSLERGDGGPGFPGTRGPSLPLNTYVGLFDGSGDLIREASFALPGVALSPPALPSDFRFARAPFDARAREGKGRYRVRVSQLPGGSLVVAQRLDEVLATQRRLLRIELVVTAAVLGGIAALSLWLVRLGLRPLERMGETAGAIAAGDLSRRVEPSDERTEVGRLGIALNTMLAQIEQSFAERRASEERLRRFVADASHELRTPLTSIRGYAELFRRGAGDRPEDLANAMRRIEGEGERMGDLVDELLLLARLDQGRPLERDPVDLSEVVAGAVDAARAVAPDRPIELETAGEVIVGGDRGRLRQIADNLLSNAIRHTPAGAPVRVSVTEAAGTAVLEVSDEGPGVPEEDRGRVFERFYRADSGRSRDTGGSGLGLSIVAAVAQAHGGRVTLDAAPQGGARFRVEIPQGPPGEA